MEGVPQPYFSHLEISGVLHKLFSIFTAVYPSISTSAEVKHAGNGFSSRRESAPRRYFPRIWAWTGKLGECPVLISLTACDT